MLRICFTILIILSAGYGLSQTPVFQWRINELSKLYSTTKGPVGVAVDFSGAAAYRIPITELIKNDNVKSNFAVSVWVKGALSSHQEYSIVSCADTANKSSTCWQIGMQSFGAWYCKIWNSNTSYNYSPTPDRQKINDGKWHQLGFTYDSAKREAAFYFDGINTAIFHTPELAGISANRLLIGGLQEGYLGEWEAFNGCIGEVKIFASSLSADYFAKGYSKVLSLPLKTAKPISTSLFTVMNYNIFHGGHETGKEVGLQRIIEVIKVSGADIISMQETYGSGPAIADALGYYFYLRSSNLGIFSRYPIETSLPSGAPFNSGGALIKMPNGEKIAFFTNWLNYPFDYWDMLEKSQAIDSADWYEKQDKVNAQILRNTLNSISNSLDNSNDTPVIFCGDFNTGSHLDWVESTRHLNGGYVMPFPATKLMEQNGFVDSYRKMFPDPLKDRGITWSPQVPTAFKDRIDYIFYKSEKIRPIKSQVINTHPVRYPSDHAAVITRFDWVK